MQRWIVIPDAGADLLTLITITEYEDEPNPALIVGLPEDNRRTVLVEGDPDELAKALTEAVNVCPQTMVQAVDPNKYGELVVYGDWLDEHEIGANSPLNLHTFLLATCLTGE